MKIKKMKIKKNRIEGELFFLKKKIKEKRKITLSVCFKTLRCLKAVLCSEEMFANSVSRAAFWF